MTPPAPPSGDFLQGSAKAWPRRTLAAEVPTYANLTTSLVNLSESETGQTITVSIAYDASASVFWAMKNLVPMPSPTIVRTATIQMGGY